MSAKRQPIRRIEHVPIIKMAMARCRLHLGMAQQLADHRQCFGASGGVAGNAVPQVVQPDVQQIGLDPPIPPATAVR